MSEWNWSSCPHPISDVRDWSQARRLILRPSYQRQEVWSMSAKIMLMDTVLKNIPMPKFYVQSEIRSRDTYRSVIDGQQRISAILEFINDQFKLKKPYQGEYNGCTFSELPLDIQNHFLSYELNFNEIRNATEDVVREIYSRVNRYSIPLNKQELRKADYPGHFLKVSEKLAQRELLTQFNIFTIANRRRMQDVEYTSELLAALISGPQDKKSTLDSFYENLTVWDEENRHELIEHFDSILQNIETIFSHTATPIPKTRFRHKGDFYALVVALSELLKDGASIAGKELKPLAEDLMLMDLYIEPSSHVRVFSEYAIKCTSQANSLSSRTWRKNMLKNFLAGTYISQYPTSEQVKLFFSIIEDLGNDVGVCPPTEHDCPYCDKEIDMNDKDAVTLDWDESATVFQLQNARLVHKKCSLRECSNHNQRSLF